MGRPPLKINVETKATLVRLTKDVLERIDAIVGANRRAQFIREAIEKELKRREK
jgi:predicted DNA-binding protein